MSSPTLSPSALESLLGPWRERAAGPAYRSLADRIRLLALDGRIAIESRLPAERELAARIGLSRTTVTAAYRVLREQGYAESLRGSGTRVLLPGTQEGGGLLPDEGLLDLSRATLPATHRIADAAQHAAAELPAHLGDPGYQLRGLPGLRAAVAEYYRGRGIATVPEQILITNGAQHAISLLARTLLRRGDTALIEQPSYPNAITALRATGAKLLPVNVTTEDGWDEEELLRLLRADRPSLGYLMPDFQNPTGRTMSDPFRERLTAAARASGTVLIADETTAELNIDRVIAPHSLAAHGSAVLIGSVSKAAWGGLRVGWIRAGQALIRQLAEARPASDLGTPILEQLTVTRLLDEWPEVLAARRDQLAAGRSALTRGVTERFPAWRVPEIEGGLAAWIGLGAPRSSALTLAARQEGLLLAAGPRFGLAGALERYLRLPLGLPEAELGSALDALARAWATLDGSGSPARGRDAAARYPVL
ncbi:MocR-like transcription factor YczR [Leucobacter sp. M11]|uniref:MocR-like transcription factor YczR n=1 Tax=Leucobacter sp. M11 TaxID=2993565 RepID=UPI002D7F8B91|nr:PLP-dependent aminotransferase family protein [Leucobacter sp. M11]MEB4614644.1 PLP-dependent aminotransferase family protein [Leucobacter sp. M11]